MNKTTTEATIDALNNIFLLEGLPDVIVSDNGTQFTSEQFQNFCQKNGIIHLTSAPFHPASNGEAERFVRTFKTSMKKACWGGKQQCQKALHTMLFSYRSTANTISGKSPAELLHGRQPKTGLSLLFPSKQVTGFDAKPKFEVGSNVYVKFYGRKDFWLPGTIAGHLGQMMYTVHTKKGKVRRHQNQLRKRIAHNDYQQAENNFQQNDQADGFLIEELKKAVTADPASKVVQIPAENNRANDYQPSPSPDINPAHDMPSTSEDTTGRKKRRPKETVGTRKSSRRKFPVVRFCP